MQGDIWNACQVEIKNNLDDHSYKSWIQDTQFHSFENGHLKVKVPSRFIAHWLEEHFMEVIRDSATKIVPDVEKIVFIPSRDKSRSKWIPQEALKESERSRHSVRRRNTALNEKYIFESFVVGPGNRFATAAALAVAEAPAKSYNPLFLYGGVGLGKTHLMQAIGHYIEGLKNRKTVVYVTSEQFTNELIDAIRNKSTPAFRNRYRKVDVLLIDDIQFLAGRESTQEEFFHTFNALHNAHKQIVLSSDRAPKELHTLEERLVSRFAWGLVTDIQLPDTETRIAILQRMCKEQEWRVPGKALYLIADTVKSNIRELEGALRKVVAYASLSGKPVTIDLVECVLKDLLPVGETIRVTVDMVQRAVCTHFDLRIADLKGRTRQRSVVWPRQIAMYLCREWIPSHSLSDIGEAFGGRDHTTVIHALKKVAAERDRDPAFAKLLRKLAEDQKSPSS